MNSHVQIAYPFTCQQLSSCTLIPSTPQSQVKANWRETKVTFMTKKLLIDAHQPEETRVVLLNGNKIEEFDYENNNNKQLKGNVYLAKVTRVEPSLQAAFVEYGGNRQGFLAFSEIHPDYYRIPIEDREALEAEDSAETSPEEDEPQEEDGNGPVTLDGEDDTGSQRKSNQAALRRYKIQEVITRKQILLVQVVKEERGNKGAALTTYLSLAGRYCVLMPNSNRGGGVSRKITNIADRKRLKSVVNDLEVPKGMAVIVRTAGAKRTKTEIKRDYSYLSKLWDDIRSKTLQSEAPSLINEEGSLVKRAIRDIYTNDVDEVLVEGEDSYKTAKAHMKMLIPSHAKRVIKHDGGAHLFQAHNVEPQLDNIHHNEVVLKSGGYLVINQTEALVAIDVNSGKATRERNIEETALKTNLEAADEVGRQLRLRDLSGLIVIDFIDMEDTRNQHTVERRLKDALRPDRARIQVGSISHFGLLEMSRQRLRPSLVESVSQTCPHCEGTGRVRSVNSSALQVLRIIEEEASQRSATEMTIYVHSTIALYILNQKRASLAEIEQQSGCTVMLMADDTLIAPEYRIEIDGDAVNPQQRGNKQQKQERQKPRSSEPSHPVDEPEIDGDDEDQPKKRRRGRRGGRRRKKRTGDEATVDAQDQAQSANAESQTDRPATQDAPDSSEDKPKRKRRRRGGRKSDAETSNKNASDEGDTSDSANTASSEASTSDADGTNASGTSAETADAAETSTVKKAPRRSAKKKAVAKKAAAKTSAGDETPDADATVNKTAPKKAVAKKGRKKKSAKKADIANTPDGQAETAADSSNAASTVAARQPISSAVVDVVDVSDAAPTEKKRGWWSR